MGNRLVEKEPVSPPAVEKPQPPQVVVWPTLRQQFLGPLGVISLAIVFLVGLIGFIIGAYSNSYVISNASYATSTSNQTTNAQPTTTVPNATAQSGAQPAQFTVAADGAKEFHLTAKQVMWEVVKGHRVLAWTLD